MMMKACRVMFMLAAVLAPACVAGGDSDDGASGGGKADDETTNQQRTLSASWLIKDVASSAEVACPQGFDTVALLSQRIDMDGDAVGAPVLDLYDCASAAGDATLPAGRYRISLDIESHDGSTRYASSTSAIVDLGETDKAAHFSILRDGGYFSLAWNLVGADTSEPLACEDVADLDGVELVATLSTTAAVTTDIWDCNDGIGITAGLAAGTYTVSVDAMNDQAGALGVAPELTDRVIEPLNKVTHLGSVEIPIDGM